MTHSDSDASCSVAAIRRSSASSLSEDVLTHLGFEVGCRCDVAR